MVVSGTLVRGGLTGGFCRVRAERCSWKSIFDIEKEQRKWSGETQKTSEDHEGIQKIKNPAGLAGQSVTKKRVQDLTDQARPFF